MKKKFCLAYFSTRDRRRKKSIVRKTAEKRSQPGAIKSCHRSYLCPEVRVPHQLYLDLTHAITVCEKLNFMFFVCLWMYVIFMTIFRVGREQLQTLEYLSFRTLGQVQNTTRKIRRYYPCFVTLSLMRASFEVSNLSSAFTLS